MALSRTYRKRRKKIRIGLILLAVMPTLIILGAGIYSVWNSLYNQVDENVHGIPETILYGGVENLIIVRSGTIDNAPRITFDTQGVIVGTMEADFQLTRGVYLSDDKDSSEELFTSLVIESNPEFNQEEAGTYRVKYTVTDTDGNSASASREIEVVEDVTTNTPKIVLTPSIVEIELGETFDLRKGVTMSNGDAVLQTLIQIESEPEFRIDVAGEYKIHYSVTDHEGTKIAATRLIIVKEPIEDEQSQQVTDREKPEITFESNPAILPKGEAVDVTSGVTVSDNVDSANALLANMKYTVPPELDINNPQAGEYSVVYEVTDFSGNTRYKTRIFLIQ